MQKDTIDSPSSSTARPEVSPAAGSTRYQSTWSIALGTLIQIYRSRSLEEFIRSNPLAGLLLFTMAMFVLPLLTVYITWSYCFPGKVLQSQLFDTV